MPRQHIYMKQKTLDGIRAIVDKRKNDGADASISNVSAELLDIGLRVVENLDKEKESDDGLTLEERYKKQMLEEVSKSRQCIQVMFKMIFDLAEIKEDNRYDYREYIEQFKERTQLMLGEFFPEERG
ncbi:TPA: relaxosome protein TraM [Providencia alcalifaciens]